MSRLPIVEKRRAKRVRARDARRRDAQREENHRILDFIAPRFGGAGAVLEYERSKIAPNIITVTKSKNRARKEAREAAENRAREVKKADHKLRFLDRLFGIGRGPAGLRAKWLDIFLGRN